MMATADAQTLTERQKGLAACACLMAQGDLERLEPTVRQALDNGVTINELKEASTSKAPAMSIVSSKASWRKTKGFNI